MQFTSLALRRTSDRFGEALKARDLGLPARPESWLLRARLESLSHALAAQMFGELHDTPVTEWEDLDFDEVRDSMEEFLGREVRKAKSGPAGAWSKADCSLGNAVTDHMAARVRDTLRYFSDRVLVEAG